MKLNYVLCICMIFLATCTKKAQYIPIDAGMKAALGYKPGSYWVYKDSISGRIDSFIVTAVEDAFIGQSSYVNQEQMYIYMTDYKNKDSVGTWVYSMINNGFGIIFKYKDDTLYNNSYVLFDYPFKVGGSTEFDPYDTGFIIRIIPLFSLNGQNFTNTALIHKENHTIGYVF